MESVHLVVAGKGRESARARDKPSSQALRHTLVFRTYVSCDICAWVLNECGGAVVFVVVIVLLSWQTGVK